MSLTGRVAAVASALALLAVLGLAVGCNARRETVRAQKSPALRGGPLAIERLAVVPFRAVRTVGGATPVPDDVRRQITRYVSDEIAARGLQVIPAAQMAERLPIPDQPGTSVDRRAAARIAHESFGADAVLFGVVLRHRERVGANFGAEQSASVAFEVEIYGAPEPVRLWSGNFDETQRPLSSNVFDASRLPGGGSRWLTTDELARWGASQVAGSMPLAPATTGAP